MALSAGSVSIHPSTGAVSGSGYARTLYDLEAAADVQDGVELLAGDLAAKVDDLIAAWSARFPTRAEDYPAAAPLMVAATLARRQRTAAKCNAQAAALVALVQTATITVPVPSTPTTAIGTLT
jgi:hypothetical protein